MGEFSHFDQHGNAVMVDVTKKKETKNSRPEEPKKLKNSLLCFREHSNMTISK